MPADEAAGMALVDELQDFKTECYKELVTKAGPQRGEPHGSASFFSHTLPFF